MSNKKFQEVVLEDKDLIRIWKHLFREDEYSSIMSLIRTDIVTSTDMIFQILSLHTLRCEAVDDIWNFLK
jgi:hypothetical protein